MTISNNYEADFKYLAINSIGFSEEKAKKDNDYQKHIKNLSVAVTSVPSDKIQGRIKKLRFEMRKGILSEALAINRQKALEYLNLDDEVSSSLQNDPQFQKEMNEFFWSFKEESDELSFLHHSWLENDQIQEILKRIPQEKKERIKKLNLNGCRVTDLQFLREFRNVNELSLSRCTELQNLKGIENLNSLIQLDVSSSRNLTTLMGLEALPNLTTLNASQCTRLKDITALRGCNALKTLDVSLCDGLLPQILQPVADVVSLENLSLRGIQFLDLEICRNLRNLIKLDISGSGADSISALEHLPKLKLSNVKAENCLAGDKIGEILIKTQSSLK